MTDQIKPSKLVGIGLIGVICAIGFVATICIWVGLEDGFLAVQFSLGTCFMALALAMISTTIEDLSTTIDLRGIDQIKIVSSGRFLIRRHLKWSEVKEFKQSGLTCRLKGDGVCIRLNLASFTNGDEVLVFMESHLPSGRMIESFDRYMVPSKINIAVRWVGVLLTFASGVSVAVFEQTWMAEANARLWGCLIAVASLPWAARVLESGSIFLDDQGIEQTKLFHKGNFFARHRLAWRDMVKISPWLATCKFRGKNLSIRVDASYFSDRDKVALFVNAHLPSKVTREADHRPPDK
jgi:hypothetical protein